MLTYANMQTTNAWATFVGILVPWHQEIVANTNAKDGGWDYTHALTTRFRNDGSTLCLLGLTGKRCGWGEELLDDGVNVDCISGRTVQSVVVHLVLPWIVWREMWVRNSSTEEGKTRGMSEACSASWSPPA
jgi:hypothetical protein